MNKKRRIALILVCAVMILLGAALGPIYIVGVAFHSGNEIGPPVPLVDEGATVTVTPEMNPVRLFAKVNYIRTRQGLSTTVVFPYRIQQEEGETEKGSVSFNLDPEENDILDGDLERSVTMSIRDFQVAKPTQLTVWLDENDSDQVETLDQQLIARKNVATPNPAIFLPGCAAILIGILGAVYTGIKLAFD